MALTQVLVPFNGDTILSFKDENGKVWFAVHTICEMIGLTADSAVREIKNDEILGAEHTIQSVQVGEKQARKVLCLPIQLLNGWLFSIQASKVNEEARKKLLLYKKECYEVLYNYFFGKMASIELNQKRRFDLLQEKKAYENSIRANQKKIREIELELLKLDNDTFERLELFSQENKLVINQ